MSASCRPADWTYAEATRIIGAHIGKPDLQYVQFPYADFAASLAQMGISQNVAGLYAEMARAFNEGRIKSRDGRRPESTTPTKFEDFAEALARAYQAAREVPQSEPTGQASPSYPEHRRPHFDSAASNLLIGYGRRIPEPSDCSAGKLPAFIAERAMRMADWRR